MHPFWIACTAIFGALAVASFWAVGSMGLPGQASMFTPLGYFFAVCAIASLCFGLLRRFGGREDRGSR